MDGNPAPSGSFRGAPCPLPPESHEFQQLFPFDRPLHLPLLVVAISIMSSLLGEGPPLAPGLCLVFLQRGLHTVARSDYEVLQSPMSGVHCDRARGQLFGIETRYSERWEARLLEGGLSLCEERRWRGRVGGPKPPPCPHKPLGPSPCLAAALAPPRGPGYLWLLPSSLWPEDSLLACLQSPPALSRARLICKLSLLPSPPGTLMLGSALQRQEPLPPGSQPGRGSSLIPKA